MTRAATLLIGLLLLTPLVGGQQTQPSGAANFANAATDLVTSATSATTLTISPPAGQFAYIQAVAIQNCAGSAAVTAATVTTITTTGIGTTALAYTVGSGVAAGLCQPLQADVYPNGLRSLVAGYPVTFVLPTFATNQTIRLTVVYRLAP